MYARCAGNKHGRWRIQKEQKALRATYIRVPSYSLDDRVIEMARVPQEITSDIVCVFHALEDGVGKRKLPSLSKLCSYVLALEMSVLHPAMVSGG